MAKKNSLLCTYKRNESFVLPYSAICKGLPSPTWLVVGNLYGPWNNSAGKPRKKEKHGKEHDSKESCLGNNRRFRC